MVEHVMIELKKVECRVAALFFSKMYRVIYYAALDTGV
jgi:hypothetical protein